MKKKRVAILFGGKSGEHEVSITSAISVHNALDKSKYDVTMIGIDKNGRWLLPSETQLLASQNNPRLLKLNKEKETVALLPFEANKQIVKVDESSGAQTSPMAKFDVIVPILHGTYGEDGTIQGLLELSNIPYVGTGVLGSSVGMDKDVSRRLMVAAGIPCVETVVLRKHEFQKDPVGITKKVVKQLGLPFFTKPANMGSSVGVAKVKTENEAQSKIEQAFAYDNKVLAEKGIAARELEVAVLGNDEPKASIVGEIIPTHEFYSYEAKYIDENGAALNIPAKNLSPDLIKQVQELAIKAFKTLECSGLARVDFFLDKNNGQLYLNEINTLPGFTSISMYPKLWAATGIEYSDLLDELIKLAIERHTQKNSLRTSYDPDEE